MTSQPIAVGYPVPDASVFTAASPPAPARVRALLPRGRRWLVVCVPGAFTPGCSKVHLPGFVANGDKLRAAFGADGIAFVAANDGFVMEAWGQTHGVAAAGITMVADPLCAWGTALGLVQHPPFAGEGQPRYRRAALLIAADGTLERLWLETQPRGVHNTGAEQLLAQAIGKSKL